MSVVGHTTEVNIMCSVQLLLVERKRSGLLSRVSTLSCVLSDECITADVCTRCNNGKVVLESRRFTVVFISEVARMYLLSGLVKLCIEELSISVLLVGASSSHLPFLSLPMVGLLL